MDIGLPWTEKYRPKKLEEVIGQKEIVERLEAYVKNKNLPNLLFAGNAGIGKTTCALALAHDLFGDLEGNFLELNASDTRGIDVVRGKIKDFARTLPMSGVPFKIIFLDEADALTPDAQHAMRRTMEQFAGVTRFILSCNYSSRIIEPIQSRCVVFKFKQLSDEEIKEMIERIRKEEKFEITEDAIEAIRYIAEGDMRKAINALQGAAALNKKITGETIYKVSSRAKPKEVEEMVEAALKGKFKDARDRLDRIMIDYGMSGEDVLLQIYKQIITMSIPDEKKVEIVDRIGEYTFRIVEGANERIQLEALLAQLTILGKKKG